MENDLFMFGKYSMEENVSNEEERDQELFDSEESEGENNDIKPISDRKLFTDKADRSLADLFRMIESNDLILAPDYQRDFIWSKKQMSLFIESLLIKIPVPTIFFAENPDGTIEVIDGQQRLTSVYKFMKGELTLSQLKTLPEFNNKKYSDFDDTTKRIFDNSTLFTVTVKRESTPEIKFDIFSRINQGSIKLNDQELRNVIYRGPLIDKTKEFVSSNKIILDNFKVNSISKKRKLDMEFVLRLLSLSDMVIDNKLSQDYNGRIGDSITIYLEKFRNDHDKIKHEFQNLEKTLVIIRKIFKGNEFRIFDLEKNTYSPRINRSVADLQYIVFNRVVVSPEKFELYEEVFNNFVNKNIDLFKSRTGNTTVFERRLEVLKEIEAI